jgi:RND family efflux transporter MFP subunit
MKMAVLPLAIIATTLAGCRHDEPRSTAQPLPAIQVEAYAVNPQRTPDIHEVVGTVRAKISATVSGKIMASILKIHVTAGDIVAAGQTIAELDDRALQADFTQAKADFDRMKLLLEKQAATRAEFEAVESRYKLAATALSHSVITAPFDGIVSAKMCEVGDLAVPGKPLFVLEQPLAYRLEASVPERFTRAVALGKSVHVIMDATGEKCAGTIGEIEPTNDPASRSFTVKIDLPCKQPLRAGMFGRAQLLVGERFAMFVAKSALRMRGQLTYVFVVADGRAHMRLVRTGKEYLGAVEILSGLQPGEVVVTQAGGELADGQPVTP